MDTKVAVVYMRPAMSVPIEVGPGRQLNMRGGYAEVDDPSMMPTLLCDPRLTIELTERYRDHLLVWLATLERQVRKPRAQVHLPNGVHLAPPEYLIPETADVLEEIAEAEGERRSEALDRVMIGSTSAVVTDYQEQETERFGTGWEPSERPNVC